MFGPGWAEGCPSCSFISDHIDGSVVHLAARDVRLAVVSRAPLAEIGAFQKRMGWRFHWVSSYGSDFNYDYQVSMTKEELAKGQVYYNYVMQQFPSEERPGTSVFYKDGAAEERKSGVNVTARPLPGLRIPPHSIGRALVRRAGLKKLKRHKCCVPQIHERRQGDFRG